ncbi:POT family-domain-containing protein [Pisolithus orientalis]|uniref:POT family-domain-containing protein n=1 Tax=Pisolithus orientalis TaxID=936130 RepID=UPI002224FE8A|nr:POT family-domain-containing protein [Pisolithus orientalis]KAI6020031.1 POT family-domain-containing protein [Pisolithus orientalis]
MAGLEPECEIPVALAEVERHEKIACDYALQKKHTISDATVEKVDPLHEGLEFPTEEELVTLRRMPDAIPWTAYMIAVVGLAERFSYYGASAVFVNFIQQPLPPHSTTGADGLHGQSGALGRGQQMSAGLTTFYQFWSFVTPIAGAYVADTYWGRYKTVCVCVAISMFGQVIMIISAVPGIIGGNASLGLFILSLIVTGMGAGGFKSNISPLVAEQYRRTKMFISVTKTGERVIMDPSLTTSRIYMYFYFFINIGALVGQVGVVYVEKFIGYWLAYTLPTVVFLLSPLVLWYGHGKYHTSPPTGSVLATAIRVWRFAMRGRWCWNPIKTIRNLTADDFWESAKPSKVVGEKPAWMKFDDNWVEEVRRGFKACSAFLWFPVYWLSYNQLNNNLTSQAATMSTHGLPNDVLPDLDPLALIIFIPLCDLVLYPALVRWRINFRPLQRIALGFYTGAAAMAWAAVVQHYIYKTNPCGYYAGTCVDNNGNPLVSTLNVWIQSGSYVLIAFSEIFATITSMEYAFTKAPRNMRSLVMSMLLFTNAIASAVGEAFVSLSTDPLLVWNYGSIAVICGISGIIFWILMRKLNSEEDELNNMAEGRFD